MHGALIKGGVLISGVSLQRDSTVEVCVLDDILMQQAKAGVCICQSTATCAVMPLFVLNSSCLQGSACGGLYKQFSVCC